MRMWLGIVFLIAGCASESGGDPAPAPIAEVEPNDTTGIATVIGGGGTWTFTGACPDASDNDDFIVNAGPGMLSVELAWDDSGGQDLDLEVFDTTLALFEYDNVTPPGDSPAEVSAEVLASGDVFVEVQCRNAVPRNYEGTVVVP